ncbi:hypothetical protein BGX38DRAFT_1225260 [Terfezia claveryi]|nr:hypothetical protein BGX38DRAFT_1225260 [Terfezia claveryi]
MKSMLPVRVHPPLDYSATPTRNLPNERERDLRSRTLSTLLFALRTVDPIYIKNLVQSRIDPQVAANQDPPVDLFDGLDLNGCLDSDDPDGSLGMDYVTCSSPGDTPDPTAVEAKEPGTDDKPSRWLQHLNCVARLLVREHEIVAVLPKRTGSDARFSMVFTTDSSSDADSDTGVIQQHDYVFSRNPRSTASPPATIRKRLDSLTDIMVSVSISDDPLEALGLVSTVGELDLYLYRHSHVPFATHVASIELLLNNIIRASNAYQDDTEGDEEELSSHFILRQMLLMRYITLRSVGKMQRRFVSPAFQELLKVLRGLGPADMTTAIASHAGQASYTFTDLEQDLFDSILYLPEFSIAEFPKLREAITKSQPMASPVLISWEFHQLFLRILGLAQTTISTLYSVSATENTPFEEFTQQLSSAQKMMDHLNTLVHDSPFAKLHIQSLEPLIRIPKATEGGLDQDDATLELSGARQNQRLCREILYLMVTFQSSLDIVTGSKMLPKQKVRFSYFDALQESDEKEAGERTALHDWRGVIKSIFPTQTVAASSATSTDAGGVVNGDDAPITAEEVIEAMASYGASRKTRNTFILRTPPGNGGYRFLGCCHAEATLATMWSLSRSTQLGDVSPPDAILAPFRNTYFRIGASKRCCPLCALLISLLSPHATSQTGGSPNNSRKTKIILSYHQNMYPTALPRFLPERVAVEALAVMEKGMMRLGEVLVQIARRYKKSKEKRGTVERANSRDSNGESPIQSGGESEGGGVAVDGKRNKRNLDAGVRKARLRRKMQEQAEV